MTLNSTKRLTCGRETEMIESPIAIAEISKSKRHYEAKSALLLLVSGNNCGNADDCAEFGLRKG
jgi:hypothetical protein